MQNNPKPQILITEQDQSFAQNLKDFILLNEYDIFENGEGNILSDNSPDLCIVGHRAEQPKQGLNMVKRIRHQYKDIPLIFLTSHSSESFIKDALIAGATDYLKLPVSLDELITNIERSIRNWKKIRGQDLIYDPLIGEHLSILEIKNQLLKLSNTDCTALITGETGTGKELAATMMHRNSIKHRGPFVCINCAAFPESLIESELFGHEKGAFTGAQSSYKGKLRLAEGGTVFLDEIGEMPLHMQTRLLRVIENKEVYAVGGKKCIPLNVRILAATNQDLHDLMNEGRFRKDLYFRLSVVQVHLPPLRERIEDIPLLIKVFIREMNNKFGYEVEGFSEEALAQLFHYDWPGNVRELKNLIEASFINISSPDATVIETPKIFQSFVNKINDTPGSERGNMLSALTAEKWNKSKAAQRLKWSRMTLYRKMTKYNIMTPEKKRY